MRHESRLVYTAWKGQELVNRDFTYLPWIIGRERVQLLNISYPTHKHRHKVQLYKNFTKVHFLHKYSQLLSEVDTQTKYECIVMLL